MTKKVRFTLCSFLLIFCLFGSVYGQNNPWAEVKSEHGFLSSSQKATMGDQHSKTFTLDIAALKQQLKTAPARGVQNQKSNILVSFPNAQGIFEKFRVYEAPVLSEELAARYPNIKTYVGFAEDGSGTRARFSVTPLGFNAMITSLEKDMVLIRPAAKGRSSLYSVYEREGQRDRKLDQFVCSTIDEIAENTNKSETLRGADDQTLRTFRVAISGTAEYTNTWDDGDDTVVYSKGQMTTYISSGYNFDFRGIEFKPSFMAIYTDGAPLSVDFTAAARVIDELEVGFSYRTDKAFSGLFLLDLYDWMSIGYAYETSTRSDIIKVSSGSHELILRFLL